ncbi:phytoene dehydrogenase-like protein [Corynebacterium mucifaciens]|uniref:phytoene desaturase family protein n=1 Tax=Corynebacterium ureicelerivorans TaxID=401472 RepID=UPI002652B939|nr:NAD(P)/FAD-dependent oxidoreductase [Corynebacterium ureicelerivorans]MDN8626018.1 NAD(P)/FAD-dependent oxidoreductase [Corynebacterium ureicelerivorans]
MGAVKPTAVIVGAGPNGLTAAARLAANGWRVDVRERASSVGGAAATQQLEGGALRDLGAACHPFGAASPAFHALRLEDYGVRWLRAPFEMAHPLEGTSALLEGSLEATAAGLGGDGRAWTRLHRPVVDSIDGILADVLAPMPRWPRHPVALARFGARGVLPAATLGHAVFRTEEARALFAGSATHAITSPSRPLTGAFGLLFGALGMTRGWPVAEGGSGAITAALRRLVEEHGGVVRCGEEVRELPEADAVILNLTPSQVLAIDGASLPARRRRSMRRWRYGPAVHKVDFVLDAPVPWADPRVGQAATVHVGGRVDEIVSAEKAVADGIMPERPFVMAAQQYAADPSRGLVLWTYAHVPHGYRERYPGEVAEKITRQIERFAPGFSHVVRQRIEASPAALEAWNPNIVGGDIAGGAMDGAQLLMRQPHRLRKGLYLASASTAPGAGVHGMPGWWAAEAALRDFD